MGKLLTTSGVTPNEDELNIETHAASSGEAVPEPPQQTGIHGQGDIPGSVHHSWDEFKVKIQPARATDCDRYRKRHPEKIGDGSDVAPRVSDQRKSESDVSAYILVLCAGQRCLPCQ